MSSAKLGRRPAKPGAAKRPPPAGPPNGVTTVRSEAAQSYGRVTPSGRFYAGVTSGRSHPYVHPTGLQPPPAARVPAKAGPKPEGPPKTREDAARAVSAAVIAGLPVPPQGPKAKAFAKSVQEAASKALPKNMSTQAIANTIMRAKSAMEPPQTVFIPISSVANAVAELSGPVTPSILTKLSVEAASATLVSVFDGYS